jgi:hypothetical protein
MEKKQKMSDRQSVLFRVGKGFIYGSGIGILFAVTIYLLATSVVGLGFLAIAPALLAGMIFASGLMSGVSYEYNQWLKEQPNGGSVLFNVANGFIWGSTIGLYFAVAVFLLATAAGGLGFLTISPVALAGLIFAVWTLMGVGFEYSAWLQAPQVEAEKPAKP